MSSDDRIKIALSNKTGKHEFVYTTDQLNDLISTLIEHSLAPQKVAHLQKQVRLKKHPIPVDSLSFEPAPGAPGELLLLVGSRALELQFRLSARLLSDFYERLSAVIVEDDPK